MIELIEPFCKKESRGYQYLYDIDNPTDLMFCPSATYDEDDDEVLENEEFLD